MNQPDEIICHCKSVAREQIVLAIRGGASTLKDIQEVTGACTGNQCKELNPKGICCSADILAILKENGGPDQHGNDDCSCCDS